LVRPTRSPPIWSNSTFRLPLFPPTRFYLQPFPCPLPREASFRWRSRSFLRFFAEFSAPMRMLCSPPMGLVLILTFLPPAPLYGFPVPLFQLPRWPPPDFSSAVRPEYRNFLPSKQCGGSSCLGSLLLHPRALTSAGSTFFGPQG